MEKRVKKKYAGIRRILAAAVTIAVAAGALLIFLHRDNLSSGALKGLFGAGSQEETEESEAFTYESGMQQVFAAAGDGLAVASSSGIHLMNDRGNTVVKQVFSMTSPALACSGVHSAFYDIGGRILRVADFGGEVFSLDTNHPIISVTMNESGWMAVITEEVGYKGLVTVYDASLNERYKWYSGSGYTLLARISPDNKGMAVLCAQPSGGRVVLFAFDSEEEKASISAPEELLVDLCYLDSGNLCALSETRAVFFSADGSESGTYAYGGLVLADYDFKGNGFVSLFLGRYRSGNAGLLLTLDKSGEVLGQAETEKELVAISAKGKSLVALYSDALICYSQKLEEKGIHEDILGVKTVIVRDKGDMFLLSAYSAGLESAS